MNDSFVVSDNQNVSGNGLTIPWTGIAKVMIAALLLVPSEIYRLPVTLPFDLDVYRVVIIIVLVIWATALMLEPEIKFRATPFDLMIAFLMLSVFLSLLVNLSSYEPNQEFADAIKGTVFFASFFLVFYFLISTIKMKQEAEEVLRHIVLLAGFVAFFGIIERFTEYNVFRHLHEWIPIFEVRNAKVVMRGGAIRMAGSVVHPIAFTAILAMVAPLAFHYWQTANEKNKKVLFGCATALIIMALLLSGSRTSFVALLGVMFILFLGLPAKRRLIVVALLLSTFIVHMLAPGSLDIIRTMLSPDYIRQAEIGNKFGRIEDYPRIWAEFSKRPAFGLGYYAFRPEKFFFVDNQYLKFLVEIGLLGTVAIVSFCFSIPLWLWRSSRELEVADKSLLVSLCASCMAFMITCATFDAFGFSQVPYLFFIISALGITYVLDIKNKFEFNTNAIDHLTG